LPSDTVMITSQPILRIPLPETQGFWPRFGLAMQRHRRSILTLQWGIVVAYLLLVIVPAFLPPPPEDAHIWNNLRLFAQFAFWGIWWPFVMLATMGLGRVWCGVFCPEGALTEWASHYGLGKPVPRWLKWGGWPFVAFVCTTVYGQLVSVYEYPQAAMLVLGGSTLAALAIGLIYGRGRRVWCRHLCPANGIFALLAKVSPWHFHVDRSAWIRPAIAVQPVDCAPLVDIRRMTSTSECHACGRCAGNRDAVELRLRRPDAEILSIRQQRITTVEALTLTFGVIGIASAAFQWSASRWFVLIKTALAEWLVNRDAYLLLQDNAPWWLLTHYPETGDVFTWLDGLCVLGYILGGGGALGLLTFATIFLSAKLANDQQLSWQRLSMALVPLAGIGVFLGLSMLTLGHLKAERIVFNWVPAVRIALLMFGSGFSLWLGGRLLLPSFTTSSTFSIPATHRLLAFTLYVVPILVIGGIWLQLFFGN